MTLPLDYFVEKNAAAFLQAIITTGFVYTSYTSSVFANVFQLSILWVSLAFYPHVDLIEQIMRIHNAFLIKQSCSKINPGFEPLMTASRAIVLGL